MKTTETRRFEISFEQNDLRIIDRLVREQVGSRTIAEILDEFSYVFDWYRSLLNMFKKVFSGQFVTLEYEEYNALATILSKAYNSENEPEKEAIKAMCDAIELQRNAMLMF